MCAWQHGLGYAQQKDALLADGCSICTLLTVGMRKYLYWFLYESVNDAHIRRQLLESKGFCRIHAWQLYQIEREEWGDSLDAALLYEDVIKDTMQALDGLEHATTSCKPKRWLFRNLSHPPLSPFDPQKDCPACEHQRQMEGNRISFFLESLREPEFQEMYRESFGLCISHFWRALETTDNENLKTFLISVQRAKIERLSFWLEEYIRKHDYRFANEPKREETKAPRWAIEMMVGKPYQK